jgi:hypothetical protein
MLWDHIDSVCKGTLLFILLVWGCAAYAYLINSRRSANDPDKKEFYLAAVFLTPITVVPFLVGYIVLFIVRALFYGIFLVVFIFALIVIRNAFLLEWLHKKAASIGNKLLAANTLLIKLFLRPWASEPI